MRPTDRPPTHPGEILLEEFLKPHGLSQTEAARRMGISLNRLNEVISGKRGITADTAVLLSELFDTTPESWMQLQAQHDLWHAIKARKHAGVKRVRAVKRAAAVAV